MDDFQFFLHIYDVGRKLELAGVHNVKSRKTLLGGGDATMTKKEIDAFLEGDQVKKVAELAERVYTTQRGLFRESKKNRKYKVFKRPVVVSVAINGKLVSTDYKVFAEKGLTGVWGLENKEQVRKMKEAIEKAHQEIANAKK